MSIRRSLGFVPTLIAMILAAGCSGSPPSPITPSHPQPPTPSPAPSVGTMVMEVLTQNIKAGVPASFSVTVSDSASSGTLTFDFGGGSVPQVSDLRSGVSQEVYTYTYRNPGLYTVVARYVNVQGAALPMAMDIIVN